MISILSSFFIKHEIISRRISIDIKGLGFGLNWVAEIFVNVFVDVFKSVIIWLIEDEVFKVFQQAISTIIFG